MNNHVVAALICSTLCTTAIAGTQDWRYFAILDLSVTTPAGLDRRVEITPTSDRKNCEAHLAEMRTALANVKKQRPNLVVTQHMDACVAELPPELKGITQGLPLKGAYYMTRNLVVNDKKFPSFDVLYGLDKSRPQAVCDKLVEVSRANFPDVACVPPMESKSR